MMLAPENGIGFGSLAVWCFQSAFGHFFFAKRDFVEDHLRCKQLVLVSLPIPPILCELLAGSLQQITRGPRDNITRDRALDVNTHG